MKHKVDGKKLGRATDHRLALYRNMVTELLDHEKIKTTEAKAKEIRGMAEHMITLGKDGSLSARRRALAFIYEERVTEKVFKELAPRYAERTGGYTRITKLGPRIGDNAEIVQLELVK
jgi:large subunit ribosomal protein L17